MNYIPVGLDIAKHVIQLHVVDFHTGEMVDKQIRRDALLTFFSNREPCLIGMEACGGSQHWVRELEKLGHKVRLMPGQFVKAFVMGNKNDVMDARAIWQVAEERILVFPVSTPAFADLRILVAQISANASIALSAASSVGD